MVLAGCVGSLFDYTCERQFDRCNDEVFGSQDCLDQREACKAEAERAKRQREQG